MGVIVPGATVVVAVGIKLALILAPFLDAIVLVGVEILQGFRVGTAARGHETGRGEQGQGNFSGFFHGSCRVERKVIVPG